MTMFDGNVGFDGGGDGHVLDLVTAVKDGVLSGVGGEKLDLRMMVEELELCDVSSVFICPISLEAMQDPVTLYTGQTYEKSNILKWFSLGLLTCPTTMQELWDDTVTPNRTLYHLIYTWFSQKYRVMKKKKAEDVQGRVAELVETLKTVKGQTRVQALKELRQVVVAHANARQALIDKGGIAVVSSLLGPFTSHVVGSVAIGILVHLLLDSESRMSLMQPAKVSLTIYILNEGSIETICKLAPEECSSIALDAGLAAKLLIMIQSCNDPVLKQQSSELLKLCSLKYSDTIFISKCKLSRTIQ